MRTRKKKCTEPWPNRYRDLQSHTSGIIVGECWRYCTCLAVSFQSLEVMKYMWTNHCATVGQRLPGKFEVSGTSAAFYRWHTPTYQITLLRVIPTMTFIQFLTGKSSGILSDISSGILSGILSGISSGICSGISSGILSGKSSGILSGISSGILSDISSGILSGISSGILSDISSGILSDIPSGISSGILSGRWGPAVHTGIWSSGWGSGSAHWDLELAVEVRQCPLLQLAVEVRQCPLRSATRGWGPAVPTGIWSSRWRSGCAHWALDCEEEAEEAEVEAEEAEEEENSSDKI